MPSFEQPHIVIPGDTDPAIARRIQTIDRNIQRDPESFLSALRELGSMATDSVVDTAELENRIPTVTRAPAKLIKEFLNNRYDLDSEFDEATERSFGEDKRHLVLVEAVRSKRSATVRTGQMSSMMRANAEAPNARDELRRYKLRRYIARNVAFKRGLIDLESAV